MGVADAGTFKLRFRTKVTAPIPFNANKEVLEKAIEALDSLGGATYAGDVKIELVPNTGSQICSANAGANGTKIRVYFESELGDLPPIVPVFQISGQSESTLHFNNTKSETIVVYTDGEIIDGVVSIKGATESNECADRGICERETGLCHCFHGFGSSNGNGMRSKAGTRGDCGYVLPTFTIQE